MQNIDYENNIEDENLHEFVILLKETIPALKLSHEINLWDFFTEKMKIIPFLYLDWDIFS